MNSWPIDKSENSSFPELEQGSNLVSLIEGGHRLQWTFAANLEQGNLLFPASRPLTLAFPKAHDHSISSSLPLYSLQLACCSLPNISLKPPSATMLNVV